MTENFKAACEFLKTQGLQPQDRVLFVSESQLEIMIKQGEVVDKAKKTVNGIRYEIPSCF